ncbi:hypothetical protein BDK51DRAFT_28905 [Blyttiomyces helicus]|uniref:Uncharacterized protein n=2 Tax=Fungi incertae sedis TaxID=112252 RepID=A0A4P9WP72_9FUNG|nr:hypothetical protein BDK51DRAFT_28905 [Blyttiomyces helicus]|eukprot:RKO94292.1 hypothetical protein BDK51DRAFT_28905 [Blyttiomyces helicus]
MSGLNGIKVETGQDKVVNTIPALRVNMNNVELASNQTAPKSRIEIPERNKPTENTDSDSGEDFKFLENGKKSKIVPLAEKDNNLDSESERSNRSARSKNSQSFPNAQDNYTPRYNSRASDDGKNGEHRSFSSPTPNNDDLKEISFDSSRSFQRKITATLTPNELRKQKTNYLYQYEKHNKDFKYSNRKYTIHDDVDEIRDAVENVKRKKQTEEGIEFWKKMMMLLVACITMLNSTFNPMDIDLETWKTNMNYDLNIGKYDDPFEALVDKYSGNSAYGPELRILGLMGMNLVITVMAQRENKNKLADIALEKEKMKREMREEIYRENAALYAANRAKQEPLNDRPVYIPASAPRTQVPIPSQQMKGPSDFDEMQQQLADVNSDCNSSEFPGDQESMMSLRSEHAPKIEIRDTVDEMTLEKTILTIEPKKIKEPKRRGRPPKSVFQNDVKVISV